jgi:hypothetical protein
MSDRKAMRDEAAELGGSTDEEGEYGKALRIRLRRWIRDDGNGIYK